MAASTANRDVVVVSAEGAEFRLTEQEAFCSNLIKRMMEGEAFVESQSRRVQLPLVSKEVLEVVVRYFKDKVKHQDSPEKVPEFQIDPKLLIEVTKAANYLDC